MQLGKSNVFKATNADNNLKNSIMKEIKSAQIGSFKSIGDCILSLNSNGFFYSSNYNGHEVYTNRKTKETAQIYVYRDNSASAVVGRIS